MFEQAQVGRAKEWTADDPRGLSAPRIIRCSHSPVAIVVHFFSGVGPELNRQLRLVGIDSAWSTDNSTILDDIFSQHALVISRAFTPP